MKADTNQMDELDRILVVRTSASSRKCHVWNPAQATFSSLRLQFMLFFID